MAEIEELTEEVTNSKPQGILSISPSLDGSYKVLLNNEEILDSNGTIDENNIKGLVRFIETLSGVDESGENLELSRVTYRELEDESYEITIPGKGTIIVPKGESVEEALKKLGISLHNDNAGQANRPRRTICAIKVRLSYIYQAAEKLKSIAEKLNGQKVWKNFTDELEKAYNAMRDDVDEKVSTLQNNVANLYNVSMYSLQMYQNTEMKEYDSLKEKIEELFGQYDDIYNQTSQEGNYESGSKEAYYAVVMSQFESSLQESHDAYYGTVKREALSLTLERIYAENTTYAKGTIEYQEGLVEFQETFTAFVFNKHGIDSNFNYEAMGISGELWNGSEINDYQRALLVLSYGDNLKDNFTEAVLGSGKASKESLQRYNETFDYFAIVDDFYNISIRDEEGNYRNIEDILSDFDNQGNKLNSLFTRKDFISSFLVDGKLPSEKVDNWNSILKTIYKEDDYQRLLDSFTEMYEEDAIARLVEYTFKDDNVAAIFGLGGEEVFDIICLNMLSGDGEDPDSTIEKLTGLNNPAMLAYLNMRYCVSSLYSTVSTAFTELENNKQYVDCMFDLRDRGIGDKDITRVLNGEITLKDLVAEMKLDGEHPERYQRYMEATYLHSCRYSREETESQIASLSSEQSEITDALDELVAEKTRRGEKTPADETLEENTARLREIESEIERLSTLNDQISVELFYLRRNLDSYGDTVIDFDSMEELETQTNSTLDSLITYQNQKNEILIRENAWDAAQRALSALQIEEARTLDDVVVAYRLTRDNGIVTYSFDFRNTPQEGEGISVETVSFAELYGNTDIGLRIMKGHELGMSRVIDCFDGYIFNYDQTKVLEYTYGDEGYGFYSCDYEAVLGDLDERISSLSHDYSVYHSIKQSIDSQIEYENEYILPYFRQNKFSEQCRYVDFLSDWKEERESDNDVFYFWENDPSDDNDMGRLLSFIINDGSLPADYTSTLAYSNNQYKQNAIDMCNKWRYIMNQDEIDTFNYICNTNEEHYVAGYRYLCSIMDTLNSRYVSMKTEDDTKKAVVNPFGASIASVFIKPFEGIKGIGYSYMSLINGTKIRTSNTYSTADTYRGTVSELINQNNGGVWAFLYNTGMSMVDSGLVIALTTLTGGGALPYTIAVMGSSAYLTSLNDALGRGLDDRSAVALATVQASIEIAMEYWSTSHFLSLDKGLEEVIGTPVFEGAVNKLVSICPKLGEKGARTFISALYNMGTQALVEANEEFDTEVLDKLFDGWIAGDKSHFSLDMKTYKEQHPTATNEEAFSYAMDNALSDVLMSTLGGAVSGLTFGLLGTGKAVRLSNRYTTCSQFATQIRQALTDKNMSPSELTSRLAENMAATENGKILADRLSLLTSNSTNIGIPSLKVINVSEVDVQSKKTSILDRGFDSNIMNISYAQGGYDYVYQVGNSEDTRAAIERIITDNLSDGKILLELKDTRGLTLELLQSLPSNVSIRVLGDYGLENFKGFKAMESPLHTLENATYSIGDMQKILTILYDFEGGIDQNWNNLEKAKYAYNYLKDIIRYREEGQDDCIGRNANRPAHYDGLMNLIVGRSTCQGYAHTYHELLARMGIQCYEISGRMVGVHGQHAFNVVEISEGEYIIVDPTRNIFGEYYEDLADHPENLSTQTAIEESKNLTEEERQMNRNKARELNERHSGSGFNVENVDEYKFISNKDLFGKIVRNRQYGDISVRFSNDEFLSFVVDGKLKTFSLYQFLISQGRIDPSIPAIRFIDAVTRYGNGEGSYNTGGVKNVSEIPLSERDQAATDFSEGDETLKALLLNLWNRGVKTRACCAGDEGRPYISIDSHEIDGAIIDLIRQNSTYELSVNSRGTSLCDNGGRYHDTAMFSDLEQILDSRVAEDDAEAVIQSLSAIVNSYGIIDGYDIRYDPNIGAYVLDDGFDYPGSMFIMPNVDKSKSGVYVNNYGRIIVPVGMIPAFSEYVLSNSNPDGFYGRRLRENIATLRQQLEERATRMETTVEELAQQKSTFDQQRQDAATKLAEGVYEKASEAEKTITPKLQSFEDDSLSGISFEELHERLSSGTISTYQVLIGLENKLKTQESLTSKILRDSETSGRSLEEETARIGDAVRYTMLIDEANYVDSVQNILQELESAGYQVSKTKNNWGEPYCQNVNAKLTTPDGYSFEIQFHTIDSYDTGHGTHLFYEIARNKTTKQDGTPIVDTDIRELSNEIQRLYQKLVRRPNGVMNFNFGGTNE